ncbi:non-ribosomal peptide synthetase, partial [Kitasatospora sp. NPDC056531]|uniref:non-ribosomal peptide synthetase n=1 Tax=Kitasatospora sp. NPDC056531 TaxID=3345856 RepID=UPI00369C42A8
STVSFDGATFELWAPLARGAAVAISPADRPSTEELVRDVERFGVTTLFLTTALFHHLAAKQSRIFGVLRTVVVGGEAMSAEHAGAVLRAFPWLELHNGYGPTEATTFTTLHRVTPADCDLGAVPIGRSFGGARALVLDERLAPVEPGTVGELWIAGGRLAQGYLNRPELTAERFRELPGHGRAYRSGDLVQADPAGLLFLGRTDEQIKLGGRRIELGEVDAALQALPGVAGAAAAVRTARGGNQLLVGYLVVQDDFDREQAVERLRAELPAALVPLLAPVDALPTRTSGKVDRNALPWPLPELEAAGPNEQLYGTEAWLAEQWAEILGVQVGSARDDFFAIGGGSLAAARLTTLLRTRYP